MKAIVSGVGAVLLTASTTLAHEPQRSDWNRYRQWNDYCGYGSYSPYIYDPYHHYTSPRARHYGPHSGAHYGPHYHWRHGYHWGPHWQGHTDHHGSGGHYIYHPWRHH